MEDTQLGNQRRRRRDLRTGETTLEATQIGLREPENNREFAIASAPARTRNTVKKPRFRVLRLLGSLLFTAILVTALAWVSTQALTPIFKGKTPPVAKEENNKTVKVPEKTANVAQVTTVLSYAEVQTEKYKVDGGALLFRTPSGNDICAIVDNVANPNVPWVGGAIAGKGTQAAGPGVVCTSVQGPEPAKTEKQQCADGRYTRGAAAVWIKGASYGECRASRNLVQDDAHSRNDARMAVKTLPYSHRIADRGFACGTAGADLTCVELATGNGFKIGADAYKIY